MKSTEPAPRVKDEKVTSMLRDAYPTFVVVSKQMSEAAHGMLNSNRCLPGLPAQMLMPFNVFELVTGATDPVMRGVGSYGQKASNFPKGDS